MTESLEQRVGQTLTLKQELSESIKHYPATLKEYVINMTPGLIMTMAGTGAAKWWLAKHGHTGDVAQTLAMYAGYPFGYSTFFATEFLRHREKYPRFWGKEMGTYAQSFFAMDYLADLTVFTPVGMKTSLYLNQHSSLNPFVQGAIVIGTAGSAYVAVMAAFHPVAHRATKALNKKIKSGYQKVKSGIRIAKEQAVRGWHEGWQ